MIQNETVNKAIDYILNHIWENICIEDVADFCNLSKFYFAHLFKSETGESVYSFIKRVKMEQSALKLKVESQKNITDIALDYGYSSSNYSSAFSKHHKTSPVEFRRQQKIAEKNSLNILGKTEDEVFFAINKKVKITILPSYTIFYERKVSNYKDLQKDWLDFCENHKDIIFENTIFFERTYDDPTITNKDHCIYDICLSIDKSNPALLGKANGVLDGGKFAIYPFKGFMKDIYALHQLLLSVWFPRSNLTLDDRYSFDFYHTVDCETSYMEFDICLPVK